MPAGEGIQRRDQGGHRQPDRQEAEGPPGHQVAARGDVPPGELSMRGAESKASAVAKAALPKLFSRSWEIRPSVSPAGSTRKLPVSPSA